MSRIRILLADDHMITLQGTHRLLEAEADLAVVGEAADGEETLRLAQSLRPDMVVLDINMPRLHGVEVAQHLRVTLPRTRILILTGYDSEQYARVFLRLGVAGYLTKTASTQELVCALRTAWAGQRYVQPAVAVALEQTVSGSTPTPRELATLRLVADGLRNEEIGARLYITERTVRFHLDHLFRKFEVASRVELVHVAHDQGWLTPWGSG